MKRKKHSGRRPFGSKKKGSKKKDSSRFYSEDSRDSRGFSKKKSQNRFESESCSEKKEQRFGKRGQKGGRPSPVFYEDSRESSSQDPRRGSQRLRPAKSRFQGQSKERYSESRERPSFEFIDRSGKRHSRREKNPLFERESFSPKASTRRLGTVQKNRKGFAFLVLDDKEQEDIFIPPREASRYFHGDRVEAFVDSAGRPHQLKIIQHRFKELVGRFMPQLESDDERDYRSSRQSRKPRSFKSRKSGWVVYERKNFREEIYIPHADDDKLKENDWVRIKLLFEQQGPMSVAGEIVEVYGEKLLASADLPMVAGEFNLTDGHSPRAIEEAESYGNQIPARVYIERVDLSNMPFITIDGEHARDFDDAVFVEKKDSGYLLWVGIADVSYYVKEGTQLDLEAREKGTSVYFPERAFHMLPRALSEGLCSLRPNEPRLAMVAKMEFDSHGKRTHTEVMEAIIVSKRRATYNEIQAEWEANQKNRNWEYSTLFELYQKLRKMRMDRGSIDFDFPEPEVVVDNQGEVLSILQRSRIDAHRLIEEFMIAANEAVTEWIMSHSHPFVYRIHDVPSVATLEKFKKLAATVGVRVSLEEAHTPKVFADLVRSLEGHSAQFLLNTALLRSMKQAIYSAAHGIHYGLASEAYTHFTSPIRRYPDLVVHRLIRMVLANVSEKGSPKHRGRGQKGSLEKLEKELVVICEHCSYRERLAADAEREALKLKQVRAVAQKLGEEFEGKITGMMTAGFFVQIQNPFAEGMVNFEMIHQDFFSFREEKLVCVGRRTGQVIKIGDQVKVRVARADIDRRQIDFELIELPKKGPLPKRAPGVRT